VEAIRMALTSGGQPFPSMSVRGPLQRKSMSPGMSAIRVRLVVLNVSFVARDPKPTFAGPKFGREEMRRNSISHLAECLDIPTTFGGER
jgi:hypothetical protein